MGAYREKILKKCKLFENFWGMVKIAKENLGFVIDF